MKKIFFTAKLFDNAKIIIIPIYPIYSKPLAIVHYQPSQQYRVGKTEIIDHYHTPQINSHQKQLTTFLSPHQLPILQNLFS